MIRVRSLQFVALCAALLLFAVGPVVQASAVPDPLTGHWEADMTGDGKVFTFSFDFKTNGDAITGTVELSTMDRTFPITEGKIKGNDISFKAFGSWTGTINGNELNLTREIDNGRKQTMKAHRKSGN
jgi:hypothetical protein